MEALSQTLTNYIGGNIFMAYIASFAAGFLASLTPCVYPLIPITVGVIGGNAGSSKSKAFFISLSYVLGIAVTYSALGAFAALSGKLFGEIGSSPWAYFAVGNVCLLLGLNMLDVFTIPMPSFQFNFLNLSKHKGIIPAFVIGLISGVIVGPCTAPVLGAILVYVGSKQNILFGMSMLFTFALGMGVLLLIVGTFAGILSSLPKSGEWMNRVKKLFGWVLVAAAEYFLISAGKQWV